MNSKRIFILGAGSSIGHSKGLFPSITGFFQALKRGNSSIEDFSLITNYAQDILGKNVLSIKDSTNIEALFTHIEIEIERKASSDLLMVRHQLLKLIQVVLFELEQKIYNHTGEYQTFVSRLDPIDTIISFNWDTLLDNVLNREGILKSWYFNENRDVLKGQYFEFLSKLSALGEQTWQGAFIQNPYKEWNSNTGYYLKAHGSIDWFYCSNESCRRFGKIFPLLEPTNAHYCSECHELLVSLIIPPVLNKVYRQYPLIRRIWNLAAKELSSVDELIIWGYSLPPTDFHSAWLIRQARESSIKKLAIINPAVVNRKNGKVRSVFVRNFFDIFRDKLTKGSLSLYESFEDYSNDIDILKKYGRKDLISAYKAI